MIHVKYFPCIFEEKHYEFESHNLTALAILTSLFQKYPEIRDDSGNFNVRVNGKILHPYEWTRPLNDGDKVFIIQEMGYGIGELIAGLVAWIGGVGGGFASGGALAGIGGMSLATTINVGIAILSVAYCIYSYCTAPSAPKTGQGLNSSPTYGWDGAAMTVRQGVPVPVVYGEHEIGGNICLTILP